MAGGFELVMSFSRISMPARHSMGCLCLQATATATATNLSRVVNNERSARTCLQLSIVCFGRLQQLQLHLSCLGHSFCLFIYSTFICLFMSCHAVTIGEATS